MTVTAKGIGSSEEKQIGPGVLFIQSSIRWDFLWQRHQALAAAAAADGWKVVFAEPHPRGIRHVVSAFVRKLSGGFDRIQSNPVPENVFVVPWRPGYRTAVKLVNTLILKESPDLWVLAYLPSNSLPRLLKKLRPLEVIYDRVLDWGSVPRTWYPPKHWRKVEQEVFGLAQRNRVSILTDSPSVCGEFNEAGIPTELVLPAVDAAFLDHPWSEAPPNAPWGYFGAVRESEIDVAFLCQAARDHGLEVIGDVSPQIASKLRAAGACVKGPMAPSELVHHIDDWSVILLPYLNSKRSESLVPAKLWNALSTGRPVLAQNLRLPEEVVDLVYGGESDLQEARHSPPELANWSTRWSKIKQSTLNSRE